MKKFKIISILLLIVLFASFINIFPGKVSATDYDTNKYYDKGRAIATYSGLQTVVMSACAKKMFTDLRIP